MVSGRMSVKVHVGGASVMVSGRMSVKVEGATCSVMVSGRMSVKVGGATVMVSGRMEGGSTSVVRSDGEVIAKG